jgi:hypothetical protein
MVNKLENRKIKQNGSIGFTRIHRVTNKQTMNTNISCAGEIDQPTIKYLMLTQMEN